MFYLISYFYRNTGTNSLLPLITLNITMAVAMGTMIVCHLIIFIVVVRQHVKMRTLVNVGPDQPPNPVLLALKSAKKILAITLSHLIQFIVSFIGVFLVNKENGRFFCVWISYSQSVWNGFCFLAFSKDTRQSLKKLLH